MQDFILDPQVCFQSNYLHFTTIFFIIISHHLLEILPYAYFCS